MILISSLFGWFAHEEDPGDLTSEQCYAGIWVTSRLVAAG